MLIELIVLIGHSYGQITPCSCSLFTTMNQCNNYYTCYWNGVECIQ